MATIDIRDISEDEIDEIRVRDKDRSVLSVELIELAGSYVNLYDSDGSDRLTIHDEEHAKNLIKGIQKAIDLGWFN